MVFKMKGALVVGLLIAVVTAGPPLAKKPAPPLKRAPPKAAPTKPPTKAPTQPPTQPPTEPPKPPKVGKDFSVVISILNQGDYSSNMAQVESVEFQDLREKVYDAILQLYADHDYYQDTIVLSFDNGTTGSIDANLAVRFTKEGEGHLNRLTQAIQSGKLGELEVAPKYVSVGELDQTTLYPMATCPAPCGGESCWPACEADCCSKQLEPINVPLPMAPTPPPPPETPPPPPPPPMAVPMQIMPMGGGMGECGGGCPQTCAPSCSPQCCFVQKRMMAAKRTAAAPKLPVAKPMIAKPNPYAG